jgi:serine phosphatase RsbU (regulator of sigma subunit)
MNDCMKRIAAWFILSVLFLNCFHIRAGNKIDSLISALKNANHDSTKIQILLNIGDVYYLSSPDSAISYYTKALELSNSLTFPKGNESKLKSTILSLKALVLRYIGEANDNKGNFKLAIGFCQQSLKISEELNDKLNAANCLKDIGVFYAKMGNLNTALSFNLKAMKIFEDIGDEKGIAACYIFIGNIYLLQNNNDIALNYYFKALKIKEKISDINGIAICSSNISEIYISLQNYELAIKYYYKSLKAREKIGDKKGMAICYENMGKVLLSKNEFQKALHYYLKAQNLFQEISDKEGISSSYGGIANVYNYLKEFDVAIEYGKRSLVYAKDIGAIISEKEANEILSVSYNGKQDYRQAYNHYKQFKILNDSIFNIEKQKEITKMEAMYQGEKKQKEIEILEKDKKLRAAEFRRVQLQKFGLLVGFFLMLILAFVIFRSYKQKQKDNFQLSKQKAEIEDKNEELNQQNDEIATQRDEIESQRDKLFLQKKDITDSIEYARFIQQALLTSHEILDNCQVQSFILFKPRDIISGDFYWFKQIKNYLYFTAADCTGHGVPGAFMSVLGISLLNEIVSKRDLNPPALVLNELRKRLKKSLQQDNPDTTSHDGMDISLCLLDLETKQLQFSAAFNPLFLIRHNELIEYSADRMPVGVHPKDKIDFTGKEIQLQSNDQLYIFSDGYISQFGGDKGKKFNEKQFKEMLVEVNQHPMEVQQLILEKRLAEWQGNNQQIDDILVVGVRI